MSTRSKVKESPSKDLDGLSFKIQDEIVFDLDIIYEFEMDYFQI